MWGVGVFFTFDLASRHVGSRGSVAIITLCLSRIIFHVGVCFCFMAFRYPVGRIPPNDFCPCLRFFGEPIIFDLFDLAFSVSSPFCVYLQIVIDWMRICIKVGGIHFLFGAFLVLPFLACVFRVLRRR